MSTKAKIGVIGAGWWAAANHIPALKAREDVELAAVCRLGDEELKALKEKFAIPFATTDYKELLRHDGLDGVVISSPHFLHYEHAKAALERGLHVLVEKPFTTVADHAAELARLGERAGKTVMVPCGWNFSPMVLQIRRHLEQQGIGEVKHIVLHMASALTDLFAGQGLVEAKDAMFQPDNATWSDPKKAGGYGWGQLSHALTLMFELLKVEPQSVRAVCGLSPAGVDYYDAAIVRCGNGANAVLSGASTVPKHVGFQVDLRAFGDEGMLLLDIERERAEIRRHDGKDTVLELSAGDGLYDGVRPVHHFVDACLGKTKDNPSSGEVAARVVQTLEMMYSSFAANGWEVKR